MTRTDDIQSMTGFGSADSGLFSVEIRSVNHRYLEPYFRMPYTLNRYEPELRKRLKEVFSKGRFDVSVQLNPEKAGAVKVNRGYAADLVASLRQLKDELALDGEITIGMLAGFKDVFSTEAAAADEEDLIDTFGRAMQALVAMRVTEGRHIAGELRAMVDRVELLVDVVARESAGIQERLRERYLGKLRELLGEAGVDEGRLVQEAALIADRADISEEIVRLQSHVRQFREILSRGGTVGRKLDFLLQEFFREANTIASKTSEYGIVTTTVEMKNEIEKLREQVQNVQ